MSYKIAVASSDGKTVDASFGAAASFAIYEVDENGYHLAENREFDTSASDGEPTGCDSQAKAACGDGTGCGSGAGCGGSDGLHPKVALISDCRCVVCQKIGFQIQKQLEKRAIISFDIDCAVDEALEKITAYLERVDNHRSLRGIANGANT